MKGLFLVFCVMLFTSGCTLIIASDNIEVIQSAQLESQ